MCNVLQAKSNIITQLTYTPGKILNLKLASFLGLSQQ